MSENVYDKAREVIKERGWCQGTLRNGDGNVCLFGAMAVAKNGDTSYLSGVADEGAPIRRLLSRVIAEQWPDARVDGFGLVVPHWWNDEPERTEADVDLVLDKAARIHDELA